MSTYGFRGEALSSLCAMSDLAVVTRTAQQEAGVRLEYDHEVGGGRVGYSAPFHHGVRPGMGWAGGCEHHHGGSAPWHSSP